MEKQYFFDNANNLVAYLKQNLDPFIKPKLQQSLYVLWAYYSAIYGKLNCYPKELFSAQFKPTIYGTEIQKIQEKGCNSNSSSNFIFKTEIQQDVKQFIDDLLKQINDMSVFSLANRIHQDHAWRVAYKNSESLNNKLIIQDYQKYLN